MHFSEKSSVVLLVQGPKKFFSYFDIPQTTIKEFENSYGKDSWKKSEITLKIYKVEDGVPKLIKTIHPNLLENNCYIELQEDDIDVFVKLVKVLPKDKFIDLAVSKIVTSPREKESSCKEVYYVDVSKNSLHKLDYDFSFNEEKFNYEKINTDYFHEYYYNALKTYNNPSSR